MNTKSIFLMQKSHVYIHKCVLFHSLVSYCSYLRCVEDLSQACILSIICHWSTSKHVVSYIANIYKSIPWKLNACLWISPLICIILRIIITLLIKELVMLSILCSKGVGLATLHQMWYWYMHEDCRNDCAKNEIDQNEAQEWWW